MINFFQFDWHLVQIQSKLMGNICPCPKRYKKKEFTYDVHEQTFEMDDNIQNIGDTSPKNQPNYTDHDNHILTEDIRTSSAETNLQASHKLQPLPEISQIRRIDHFEPVSSNQISVQMKSQIQQQELPLIQNQPAPPPPPIQKPLHANILKGKTIKKKYNPDDYRFINEVGQFKVKKVDSIKEQQYNIENCKHSQYFIFDITANLYIDDCQDCTIFVAPCQSTIFIRNCNRMNLIAATKQFRTYNCHSSVFSLYCKSQPVIQSSSRLEFTSFSCPVYPQLPKQFSKKRLQPWNNHWSQIHNFTKKQDQIHATFYLNIPIEVDWERAFELAQLQKVEIKNPIPLIMGDVPHQSQSRMLILIDKGVTDEKIVETLDGVVILKAFQGILSGMGKQQKKVILIDPSNQPHQKFQQLGKIYTDESQIKQYSAKWFISFSDEREK